MDFRVVVVDGRAVDWGERDWEEWGVTDMEEWCGLVRDGNAMVEEPEVEGNEEAAEKVRTLRNKY